MPGSIDKQLVERRFARRLDSYRDNAPVQCEMARHLVALLARCVSPRSFETVLEIGAGSGVLTERFSASFSARSYVAVDLVARSGEYVDRALSRMRPVPESVQFVCGDIESMLPLSQNGRELVISNATFQWLTDPARLVSALGEEIAKSGLLAFSSFGPGTLAEITTLEGISLDYQTLDSVLGMLSDGFDILASCQQYRQLEFRSPHHVLRQLRLGGVNALPASRSWNRRRLAAFAARYRELFANEKGAVSLSYAPFWIVARRKT